ncbi:unknown [Salmonella phage FelixO1]|uniref:Uncharacterized protein n=1 Tax=Salmonella phage Felix O1 (isolate Felix O1-VT1) TaxID=1283336 RepID=Q6KG93_BPFO1|nr:unknown [Salmonella phage FelixO1]
MIGLTSTKPSTPKSFKLPTIPLQITHVSDTTTKSSWLSSSTMYSPSCTLGRFDCFIIFPSASRTIAYHSLPSTTDILIIHS